MQTSPVAAPGPPSRPQRPGPLPALDLDRAGAGAWELGAALRLDRALEVLLGEAAEHLAVEGVAVEGDTEDAAERLRDQQGDADDQRADHHQQGPGEPGRGPDDHSGD